MARIARGLNSLSGARLTPNVVTLASLAGHVPIAWLISQGYLDYGAIGLIIFGLFDTLDGELARLQERASATGMLLDSSTDRMKEVLLYAGIVAFLLDMGSETAIIAAVGALGASLITSYLNAWGEVVMATVPRKLGHQVNKALRTGILGFEVRMTLLVIGLITNQLEIIIYIILALAVLTVVQRLLNIISRLKEAERLQ